MPNTDVLHLSKHHGAGNDFLVVIDFDDRSPVEPALVRALCHRHLGLGADGVIRVLAGRDGTDLTMELQNADGSPAEMSGNGIRCLAQAAVDAGLVAPPTFSVWTPAGVRTLDYRPGVQPGAADASVDMGRAELGPEQSPPAPAIRARQVDMGNPHLVLLVPDPAEVDVVGLGGRLEAEHPGGINVEFIGTGPGQGLTLRVWERGAGETQACGTGSAAAAAAAHHWGLVGEEVDVHNPGGALRVTLGSEGIRLAGPVRKVAAIDVDRTMVLGAASS
jgi:diaminopimelate epimerase